MHHHDERMIGREQFERMKPTALFANVSRGRVVDQAALIAALQAERIAGAVLDVVDPEPGTLPATVVSHAFLGEKVEYELRCGEATLNAVRYNAATAMADGTAVGLRFAPEAIALLPGGQA